MSILALDYGEKRVGIAVSDPTEFLATPLPFISAKPLNECIKSIESVVQQRAVRLILVGMPYNMDGSEGTSAQLAKDFIEILKKNLKIPIQPVDERLSTVQASRLLREAGQDSKKQRKKIDSASAQVILQQFLDSQAPLA